MIKPKWINFSSQFFLILLFTLGQQYAKDLIDLSESRKQCCVPPVISGPFSNNFYFSHFGDTAYFSNTFALLDSLILNTMNQEPLAFVVHVGDYQASSPLFLISPPFPLNVPTAYPAITAEEVRTKRDMLWQLNHPFIFTPGDNDWSDTIIAPNQPGANGNFSNPNPVNGTLAAIRDYFYQRGTNVPFPFEVVSQADEQPQFTDQAGPFIENRRWQIGNIIFVTIHTVSGDNGLNPPVADPILRQIVIDESAGTGLFSGRIAANQAWLQAAFDLAIAQNAKAVVIFSQAGINFAAPSPGYAPMVTLMRNTAIANPNLQILYAYGDFHEFLLDKPLLNALGFELSNFTTQGTAGAPATGRVKFLVDFCEPNLFWSYQNYDDQGIPNCCKRAITTTTGVGTGSCTLNEPYTVTGPLTLPAGSVLASGTVVPANTSFGQDQLVILADNLIVPPGGITLRGPAMFGFIGELPAGTVFPAGTVVINPGPFPIVLPGFPGGVLLASSNVTLLVDTTLLGPSVGNVLVSGLGVRLPANSTFTLPAGTSVNLSSYIRIPFPVTIPIEAVVLEQTSTIPTGTVLAAGTRIVGPATATGAPFSCLSILCRNR